MNGKELIAFIVIGIAILNSAVYLRAMWRKEIRAHIFSWVIWGLTQTIGAMAQYAKGAGAGAWPNFFGGATCLVVIVLALFRHGERHITRSDGLAFGAALVAIPLWGMTNNPLWASILISGIDAVGGIYPTFRKSWRRPYEENLFMFASATFSYALSVFAVESYSVTTTLYPISMALTHALMSVMLIGRRFVIGKEKRYV